MSVLTISWSMLRPSDLIPFQMDLSSSYSSFICPPRGLLRAAMFKGKCTSMRPKLLLPNRHARLTTSKLGGRRASTVLYVFGLGKKVGDNNAGSAQVHEYRTLSTKRLEEE
jgi:hypothetical protein